MLYFVNLVDNYNTIQYNTNVKIGGLTFIIRSKDGGGTLNAGD